MQETEARSGPSETSVCTTNGVNEQAEVLAFLQRPEHYGASVNHVECIETHGAYVFLGGDRVYKIKRAVTFSYMDFGTLEQRRVACEREFSINHANAPQIYQRVVALTRETDGRLAIDGDGIPVEWAVQMRRFAQDGLLSAIASQNRLTPALLHPLAATIARCHRTAARHPRADGAERVAQLYAQLMGNLQNLIGRIDGYAHEAARVAELAARLEGAFKEARPTLGQRGQAGWVRRAHGDLHLNNIVLVNGEPILFDALEFDEDMATIDVLYDLAFLLMDLDHCGQAAAANCVLNRYLFEMREADQIDGLVALPLFMAIRAAVRAMVGLQRAEQAAAKEAEQARTAAMGYIERALCDLAPNPPALIAVGGFSGTGKSTLAGALAPDVGRVPGAVHLRSDLERKVLFGLSETEPLPKELYTQVNSDRVYEIMFAKARRALTAGQAVVVDAVFARDAERDAIEKVAIDKGVRFTGLWLEAPENVLRDRVTARTGDASDATPEVVDKQIALGPGAINWSRIDASGTAADTLARAQNTLRSSAMLPQ